MGTKITIGAKMADKILERIAGSILEAMSWDFESTTLIDALIETVGYNEVVTRLYAHHRDAFAETVGEEFTPEIVFTQDELEAWAMENMTPDQWDPPGYEESERY